jgi:uncharacterized protein YhaN
MNKIEEAHPRVPDSVVIGQLRQTVDEKNALLDQNLALLHQKDAQLRDSQKQLRKKDAQLQKLQKEMEEIHVKNLKSSISSPEWKQLLDTVGVTERELQDQDIVQFIHDFVQQHGGIEEANRQLDESKQIQSLPPPTRTSSRSAVTPPPNQGQEPPPLPEQGLGPDPPQQFFFARVEAVFRHCWRHRDTTAGPRYSSVHLRLCSTTWWDRGGNQTP